MKIILIISFFLTGIYGNAQSSVLPDSIIELRFRLIEKKGSGQLALDAQIINHSAKDIYIPNISYFEFHLYEQADGGWDELDLYTHQRYPKGAGQPAHLDLRGLENEINKYYKDSTDAFYHSQQAILAGLSQKDPTSGKIAAFARPIFLKAGETVGYFSLIPMDYLRQQPKTYKISYAGEERDFLHTKSAVELMMKLPEKILQYARYIPNKIMANTIYYSTIN